MATLLPVPQEKRSDGIEEVRQMALSFLKKRNMKISFPLTKPDSRIAIEELWDGLGDLDFRSLISGTLKTSMPDDYLYLLVTAVVRKQFEQFLGELPPIVAANISGQTQGNS